MQLQPRLELQLRLHHLKRRQLHRQAVDMQQPARPCWPFRQQGMQLIGAVSSIDVCGAAPHDYCVSAGTRLHVYNGATSAAKRQFGRFKDRAYSGSFRQDGRLIVAGGEDSVVQARRMGWPRGAVEARRQLDTFIDLPRRTARRCLTQAAERCCDSSRGTRRRCTWPSLQRASMS